MVREVPVPFFNRLRLFASRLQAEEGYGADRGQHKRRGFRRGSPDRIDRDVGAGVSPAIQFQDNGADVREIGAAVASQPA